VWGVDHLPVSVPATAPGRHFVARALQRVSSIDEAVCFLREHPSAGGFAFTIGELHTGRVVSLEAAAGQVAGVEASAHEQPFVWHTNHLRYLPTAAADGARSRAPGAAYLGLVEES